jgi:hypothetical protein
MFTQAGEADSLAVSLPASEKSTALVPVAPTSVTVTEVVTVSTADLDKHIRATMGTCGQLVAERDRATAEIRRQAKDVLHPALIEMRKRYNNPGARTDLLPGISTFEAYLLSIGFCSSILRVWDHRNRQKELEGLLPSDGQKLIGSGSSSGPVGSSSPVGTDHDPDDTVTGDAISALVNLGFRRADAKQAIEQALTADAKLVNDLDGLLCNALGGLSKVKPTSGNDEATAIIADDAQGVTTANPTESESAGVRLTDEGPLLVAPPAAVSKAKLLEGEVGSDQVRGAYAKLRSVFNRVADTAVIESALQDTLAEIVLPMLDQHPYMQVDTPYRPELQISVTLKRAGRTRICAGDWVVYRGGDDRLTKQIGAEAALGRVVEADAFSRPRVTWSNDATWLKPYSLFNQEAVHVLFADQAASAYPEAFSTYSELAQPKPPGAASIDYPEDSTECKKA